MSGNDFAITSASMVHIPEQSGHLFRFNADGYSVSLRTIIPF